MKKLTYLFATLGLFMFMACGGGGTEEAVTEEVVTEEAAVVEEAPAEEATDSTVEEGHSHNHSDGEEHDHDHSDGEEHDHEH